MYDEIDNSRVRMHESWEEFSRSKIEEDFKSLRAHDQFAPVRAANDLCDNITLSLNELCAAFRITGNDRMAAKLAVLSERLKKAQYFFDRSLFLDNRDRTMDAVQASANLYQLAVAMLSKKESPDAV